MRVAWGVLAVGLFIIPLKYLKRRSFGTPNPPDRRGIFFDKSLDIFHGICYHTTKQMLRQMLKRNVETTNRANNHKSHLRSSVK
jgi:hypothetical protein